MNNKCLFFHKYKIIKDTGFTFYKECKKCGKRKIEQRAGGYQPIDYSFLDGK